MSHVACRETQPFCERNTTVVEPRDLLQPEQVADLEEEPVGDALQLKTSTPSATPEPATLLLLTTGVGGLLVVRRRRKG